MHDFRIRTTNRCASSSSFSSVIHMAYICTEKIHQKRDLKTSCSALGEINFAKCLNANLYVSLYNKYLLRIWLNIRLYWLYQQLPRISRDPRKHRDKKKNLCITKKLTHHRRTRHAKEIQSSKWFHQRCWFVNSGFSSHWRSSQYWWIRSHDGLRHKIHWVFNNIYDSCIKI